MRGYGYADKYRKFFKVSDDRRPFSHTKIVDYRPEYQIASKVSNVGGIPLNSTHIIDKEPP